MAEKIVDVEIRKNLVKVNVGYVQSWDGIRKACRMESSEHTDQEKAVAMVEYFETAIANIDELSQANEGKDAEFMATLFSDAISKAISKK